MAGSREQSCCLCCFLGLVLSVARALGEILSVTAWALCVQGDSAAAWGKLSRVASLPAPVFAGRVWCGYFGVT